MKCILMNKSKEIALIQLKSEFNIIEKIYEIYNIKYVPLSFKNAFYSKVTNNEKALNEWLVSQICKKLNLDFCDYKIDVIDKKIVSKCEDFINENQEILKYIPQIKITLILYMF